MREESMGEGQKNPKRKHGNKKKKILIAELLITTMLLVVGGFFILGNPNVREELTIEAGSRLVQASDFLYVKHEGIEFITEIEKVLDINTVGDYQIPLKVLGKKYLGQVHVVDTTMPRIELKAGPLPVTATTQALDLVATIRDNTAVEIAFKQLPDYKTPGIQEITLTATDAGNNVAEIAVQIEVLEDKVPPVISGVKDISVMAGDTVSYKREVIATDNHEQVSLQVDSSQVDLNTVGDYVITYLAEDAAGNQTKAAAIVHVTPVGVENATEELVNAEADKILETIITENMSRYEKARAIFFWVYENIEWVEYTPKTNWIEGAYHGFVERRGDCFVYAMTSKCLLNRARIKNIGIQKIPTETEHYWNLIDIGEGWYHFDNTKRADGRYFFYSSDEEVLEYSMTHNGSHLYNQAEYPDIQ